MAVVGGGLGCTWEPSTLNLEPLQPAGCPSNGAETAGWGLSFSSIGGWLCGWKGLRAKSEVLDDHDSKYTQNHWKDASHISELWQASLQLQPQKQPTSPAPMAAGATLALLLGRKLKRRSEIKLRRIKRHPPDLSKGCVEGQQSGQPSSMTCLNMKQHWLPLHTHICI